MEASYPNGPLGGPCASWAEPLKPGERLSRIEFIGYEASTTECAEWPAGNNGSLERATGACRAEQEADPFMCNWVEGLSEAYCDGDANLRDANWSALPTGYGLLAPDYRAIDDCFDDQCAPCDSTACAHRYDYTFVPGDPSGACFDYGPIKAAVWFQEADASPDCTSTAADCTPGSGGFSLLPYGGGDKDGDGALHVQYLPMQTSGTGTMTRLASVTSITKTAGPSATLRVLRSEAPYDFTSLDQLANASSISTVISGTHTFASGVVVGNPVFVAEEVAEADADGYTVNMTWTCPGGSGVSRPQGYQFRLSDIGCTGVAQKMTLRYATSPKRVYLEQYGNSGVSLVEPTVTTTAGEAFVFEIGRLTIDGVILSSNANQAQVRLDEISWAGTNICATGTYTFGAE